MEYREARELDWNTSHILNSHLHSSTYMYVPPTPPLTSLIVVLQPTLALGHAGQTLRLLSKRVQWLALAAQDGLEDRHRSPLQVGRHDVAEGLAQHLRP